MSMGWIGNQCRRESVGNGGFNYPVGSRRLKPLAKEDTCATFHVADSRQPPLRSWHWGAPRFSVDVHLIHHLTVRRVLRLWRQEIK